jgi:hypothetical protein
MGSLTEATLPAKHRSRQANPLATQFSHEGWPSPPGGLNHERSMKRTLVVMALWFFLAPVLGLTAQDGLEHGFAQPPESAKPWVYWWWLDGNVSKGGITRDLEEMKRQGIAGALVFDAGEGHTSPVGARFMGPEWREAFRHAVSEARRLGLELSLNLCSGWDAGGTWVTPDLAMKRLVWRTTNVQGPCFLAQDLPKPPVNDNYYKEVAILAFQVTTQTVSLLEQGKPQPAVERVLSSRGFVNLTDHLSQSGGLVWNVPSGDWLILRFGETLMGGGEGRTKCTSRGAQGYEIDFYSREAMDRHFAETAGKVALEVNPMLGKTLTYLHDDSWECGEPNWTPRMREEFKHRRGYELLSYLPVLAGKTVGDQDTSARFLRDFRRTTADLMAENHYGRLLELSRRHGLGTHPESGGPFFVSMMDPLMNLGRNSIPMGEYWIRQSEPGGNVWYADQYQVCDTVKQAATAAHIYGKKLCQAEAFTNMGRNWEEAPFMLKDLCDRAFCAGLTRNMLCFYVHQPYLEVKPGYEWPEAGTHFDRNITWWNQMHAFTAYLARSQFLLQQGLFVADVCYFAGEDAGRYVPARNKMQPSLPAGYDCDTVNGEVLMTRLVVRKGQLVLPDRMSYRVLVLPLKDSITPEVLKKIADLVEAGATVVGPKPARSSSLSGFPKCDEKVKALADKLWGPCDGKTVKENAFGRGRVIWGKDLGEVLQSDGVPPDFAFASSHSDTVLDYIHRRLDGADIYFVSNQKDRVEEAACVFRVKGKRPELWDPLSGEIRPALAFTQAADGRTSLPIELAPKGSLFVVFRKSIPASQNGTAAGNFPTLSSVMQVSGSWGVKFDPAWGGPDRAEFSELVSWAQRPEEGIRYYSGTATYQKTFEWPEGRAQGPSRLFLDLGEVQNLAEVRLNGKNLGVAWTKPFRVEITAALKSGANALEVDVVNLWPNRLIGDGKLPPEQRRTKTNVQKFYKGEHKLLESGLLGPVRILAVENEGGQSSTSGEAGGWKR